MRIENLDTTGDTFSYENGVRAISIEDGISLVTAPINAKTANRWGKPHGGLLFTLADVACGVLLTYTLQEATVTVNTGIDFMATPAAEATELRANGRIEKRGGKMAFCSCTICDDTGKLIARTTSTWMLTGLKL